MADNKINITVSANTRKNITVSSAQQSTEITASADSGRFWAQTAKNWAVSDVIVDNTDFSSKHYAQEAKESAISAGGFETSTRETYNSFLETSANAITEIQGAKEETLTEIDNSRANAIESMNTVKTEAIDSLNSTKTTVLSDIEFVADGEKEEIRDLANDIKEGAEDIINRVEGGVKDLEDKTLEGIERLRQSSTALTQSQVTNCLLEVPQRIKLELADGVLTLKAGSEVIVPNGFEADGTTPKFDSITISNDVKMTIPVSGRAVFVYNAVTKGFDYMNASLTFSGSSHISSTGGISYNTATNNVRIYSNANVIYSEKVSLPFALIAGNGTQITSIDQVFNGIGYIGSTVWVDKGVKGLIPNGRNEDGTLKNIEYITPNIFTRTYSLIKDSVLALDISNGRITSNLASDIVWNEYENIIYEKGVAKLTNLYIGNITALDNKITLFKPKQPVRLATTDMVDGQWQKLSTHTSILSVNSFGEYEVDLSAFLPKDGYPYEIILFYRLNTQLKLNDIYLWYLTSLMLDTNVYYAHGGGANDTTWYRSASSTTIPIGVDRKLIFKVNTTATPSNINYLILNLSGYRRLGMNS